MLIIIWTTENPLVSLKDGLGFDGLECYCERNQTLDMWNYMDPEAVMKASFNHFQSC